MHDNNASKIIGCDNSYEESRIVVFGAPFDGTVSYRPGARFGSSAVRSESYSIETYSPYQDRDLEDIRVFDAGDLELPLGNTVKVLEIIEEYAYRILNDGKIPFMIGGEHLVSLGAVRAAVKKYKDLHIIHFDAHSDLRDEYLGESLSHATVMRRCWELVGDRRIFQFGIRSGSREEIYWGKDHVYTSFFDFSRLDGVVEALKGKPVYLTIDLDVLDTSVFPGTGTPEAGGVTFSELLDAVGKVSCLDIVALDMTELSPPLDPSGASTVLACKLLREVLLYVYK
ncbi:agmatinase SpeB [Thermoclostridium stercorarium subsp. stercorarium DSM 8532]|jgi:agmatinase|uniref:Agmatinase SpeB n=3 Tax=Thermoclostridium stercorarium TaxID=1510 RepID=L7VTA0_THES1|nr:agmatinase [Thermoclostridium stercorarium]AGC68778.1 agmatinase SpeB [Thermoclostridium stercorarium subsp. stercorarium DSM 8532]AGI39783.1 agmatinase [Thermoclostridium stercorarium subsp. stercorarium DSM 8532]ANW99097.1 agmatinase [Thermoclostridium stercorarium subsp. thermolacticum DSM 2910]ANX01633.1 agmatinase [Thermoclostridium stercorarium subsp. leptospartum DSM 9219]UZQ84746.1 agmatinase [Thermoclostridium stercorarium]